MALERFPIRLDRCSKRERLFTWFRMCNLIGNRSSGRHMLCVRYVKASIIHDPYVISFKIISIRIINIVNVQSDVILNISCPLYCI